MPRIKFNLPSLVILAFVLSMFAFPAFAQNAGDAAEHVTTQIGAMGKLALAAMFLAGIGVAAGSAFKFKAHSENASQVPLKVPLFWAIVAAILIAIPTFLAMGTSTIFGEGAATADVDGGLQGNNY